MEQATESRGKLTGSLSDRCLVELLTDWHKQKKSGSLILKSKQFEKFILFDQGSILRAQSNQEQEKIGQILVKKAFIKPWDLEVALSQLPGSIKRIGQVLVDMKALKESALQQTLLYQTRDILFSMLDWQEGEYSGQDYPDLDKETPMDQLYTPEILLQGIRKLSNLDALGRLAGDAQIKLKLSSD